MSVTFVWNFDAFEVAPIFGNFVDVVRVIHWRLDAVDGEYRASSSGATTLPDPAEGSFTGFDSITKQWAINAVSSVTDIAAIEVLLESQIAGMKTPSIIFMPPPFSE